MALYVLWGVLGLYIKLPSHHYKIRHTAVLAHIAQSGKCYLSGLAGLGEYVM